MARGSRITHSPSQWGGGRGGGRSAVRGGDEARVRDRLRVLRQSASGVPWGRRGPVGQPRLDLVVRELHANLAVGDIDRDGVASLERRDGTALERLRDNVADAEAPAGAAEPAVRDQ